MPVRDWQVEVVGGAGEQLALSYIRPGAAGPGDGTVQVASVVVGAAGTASVLLQ